MNKEILSIISDQTETHIISLILYAEEDLACLYTERILKQVELSSIEKLISILEIVIENSKKIRDLKLD